MSLLLDALKRAEQEKLSRAPERSGGAVMPQAANSASSLELQPVTPAPSSSQSARNDAAAAQNVFKAKTAVRAEPARRNRGALWAIVVVVAIVVAAAAGYVWYSIKLLTPPPIAAKMRPRPPAAPTPAPASAEPSSASKMEALMQPGATAGLPLLPPVTAKPPAAVLAMPATPQAAAQPAATAEQAAIMKMLKDAPASGTPAAETMMTRSSEPPRIPAQVVSGYASLRSGDFAAARRQYGAALAADPTNLDAQLGLATAEARSGNHGAAAAHYRRALDLDPRNPTAAAGMAALADTSRPEAVEMQLRTDVARSPHSAPLHFALGNLYVSQSRWSEAQASYFEAHRLDPGNADTMYNLAVSLDHLRQSKLALDYYGRALAAARGQATQLDPAQVSRRIAELRQ